MKNLKKLSFTAAMFAVTAAGMLSCADQSPDTSSNCGTITAEGICEGASFKYCENDVVKTLDCGLQNQTCGKKGDSKLGCIATTQPQPSGCGSITAAGTCDGNVYKYCENNILKTTFCTTQGKVCASTGNGAYACIQSSSSQPDKKCEIPNGSVCNGNVVDYCDNAEIKHYDCQEINQTCGVKEDGTSGCIEQSNPPETGCGNVPDTGVCDGNTVRYCEDNTVKHYDCTQNKQICSSTGNGSFGCVDGSDQPQTGCGSVPNTGVCEGTIVKYCEENTVKQFNCSEKSQICGSTGNGSFGCIDGSDQPQTGCGSVPDTGVCEGTIVKYCEGNTVKQFNCTEKSQICGSMGNGSFGCIAGGSDQPSSLVTAEDWARARIAGTVNTSDAFNAITKMSGFPVETSKNTIIFMHWYEGGNWSVAGDFNNWNPQKMTSNGDIWYAEVQKPDNAADKPYYKFVNDGKYTADPWASRYNYTEDGEISYITKPKSWHLMRWRNMTSPQGLKTRDIFAYVPAGSGPFDVVYAHDGQNLFRDGEGSWRIQDAIQSINGNFIVVGIPHADEDRLSEYAHVDDDIACGNGSWVVPGKGKQHAAYLQETIRPFINSQLKTTHKTGIMGSSMGGLISLYTAHLYPNDFKMVIAMSPTTAWGRFGNNNGTTIEDLYAQNGHRNFILYLDNGGFDINGYEDNVCKKHTPLDSEVACIDEMDTDKHDDFCYTRSFVDKMATIGYEWEKDLFHWFEPNTGHRETAWHGRLAHKENSPFLIFMNAK